MKVYRSHAPETLDAVATLSADVRLRLTRNDGPDVLSIARCPRCGFELVARMAGKRPVLWCRCAGRLPRAAA